MLSELLMLTRNCVICRFVHPGVTDKGNYTMFDMVRPLVAMNSGPPPPMHMFPGGPMEPMYGPRPMERPMVSEKSLDLYLLNTEPLWCPIN